MKYIWVGEEMNLHLGHLRRMNAPRVWALRSLSNATMCL